mgnify:CR=1 FL=1
MKAGKSYTKVNKNAYILKLHVVSLLLFKWKLQCDPSVKKLKIHNIFNNNNFQPYGRG